MSQQHQLSIPPDPAMEITRSILTEAAQRPWLAALLMRRRPDWLTRLAQLAQRVRDLPRHTRRALRRKLASGLAAAALLLALTNVPTAYAGTIVVDGVTCSLNSAIMTANSGIDSDGCTGSTSGVAPDTIDLQVDVNLTTYLQFVTSVITIEGNNHTIQRTGSASFSVLRVSGPSGDLTLNKATISGGKGDTDGGGILNSYGTLTVKNSTISGNTATNGGGILNLGSASVQNSSIVNNTATYGGGIFNGGTTCTLTVSNSTISGNTAHNTVNYGVGGGIFNNGGTLTVTNGTIVSNTASGNGGSGSGGIGGGLYISGTATVQNSIVVSNTASTPYGGDDCMGTILSPRYNIEGATTCGFTNGVNGNNQLSVSHGNLNLQPLADNGGPTPTHALGALSVAIDKVPTGTSGTIDQRGMARDYGTGANRGDIGAYEVREVLTQGTCGGPDLSGTQTFAFASGKTVTIDVNTANGLKCITVEEAGTDHLGATGPGPTGGTLKTGNWWHITGNITSGFDVNLTLPTNFTPASGDRLCRYTKTGPYGWVCGLATAGGNTLTLNNVTAFSDWGAGQNVGPNVVAMRDLTATANAAPGVIGALGAAFAALGALWAGRRRLKVR